jgi:hypothetical protein
MLTVKIIGFYIFPSPKLFESEELVYLSIKTDRF